MLSKVSFQELNHTMLSSSMGQSLTNLWGQFNGEYLVKNALADRLYKAGATVIVAINKSQMIGFVCLSHLSSPILCADCVEVWALFVIPTARMHGIGRALIEQIERKIHSPVRLFVSADETQIPFYQKCGYELSGASRMTKKCIYTST